jgi:hypothetical protein
MLSSVWIFSLRSFFVVVVTYYEDLVMLKDTVFTVVSPNVTALHCCHENALSTWAQTLTAFPLMTIGACTVIVLPLKILTSLTYTILLLLATSFTTTLTLSIFTVLFVIFTTSSFLDSFGYQLPLLQGRSRRPSLLALLRVRRMLLFLLCLL